jgi:hypothetical protein
MPCAKPLGLGNPIEITALHSGPNQLLTMPNYDMNGSGIQLPRHRNDMFKQGETRQPV